MNFKRFHESKNLFDKDSMVVNYYLSTNGAYTPTGANSRSILFKCEPYTTYTFKGLLHKTFRIATYTYLPTSGTTSYVHFYNRDTSESVTTNTISTGSGENYVVIFCYNNTTEANWYSINEYFSNVMLNVGDEPLPYEPYSSEVWHVIPHYIYTTATDTLTLPAVIYGDGTNATVGLKGNMQQTGTPTPTTPIQPSETGERTGNLFDYTAATLGKYINASGQEVESSGSTATSKLNHTDYIPIDAETNYTIKSTSTAQNTCAFCWFDSSKTLISRNTFDVSGNYTQTAESPLGAAYMIINYITSNQETVMVNTGSTPLPYEPYGYNIPILNGSVTTNVYLGEVQTVRQIKKLVLTGEEGWTRATNSTFYGSFVTDYFKPNQDSVLITMCSHYVGDVNRSSTATVVDKTCSFRFGADANTIYIRDTDYNSGTAFKTYLSQQYANGTPVTVWYVLAEPSTGIVNEPIRKIGDYADTISSITAPTISGKDTFDVQTTLKPSEVSLSYTGWHDATVKEWDGSEWKGEDTPALLSLSRPEPIQLTEEPQQEEPEQEVEDEQSI